MPLSGTWLYLGNYRVLGGSGSSPSPDIPQERAALEGQTYSYDTGMQFVETTWTTNWDDTAYPRHNTWESSSHYLTYDLGSVAQIA